ncbi:MAG: flagellar basal body P-ring protein FlgI [Planctomycetaceae bacterium]|nr:flagellar basal body P-ring protein FlgI [Planctomycetaceae bacterium]
MIRCDFFVFGAVLRVENVVRVKGQEGTVIQGFGIVTGLSGTGDDLKSFSPTAKSILQMLTRSGLPEGDVKSISSSRNCALVEVSVTIPATGARSGDYLDCAVSSAGNAKSLRGGRLSQMKLFGPIPLAPDEMPILGMAWGNIVEDPNKPNNAVITRGCRLTADFNNPYIQDGCVTLVLKPEHANMRMAFNIASSINNEFREQNRDIAQAIDGSYIVVRLPKENNGNPMKFMDQLLAAEVLVNIPMQPQVLIDEKTGTIVIDEDVTVKPVVISHKNIDVEIRPPVLPPAQEINPQQFVDVDTETKNRQFNGEAVTNTKLKALQASLDALRVSSQDMIEIIKTLHENRAIIGEVKYK